MNRKGWHNRVGGVVVLALGLSAGLWRTGEAASRDGATTQPVNPHWREPLCVTCHPRGETGKPDGKRLLDASARENCRRCHTAERLSSALHHPYDLAASPQIHLPPDWPLDEDRRTSLTGRTGQTSQTGRTGQTSRTGLTCLTCHDVLRQCLGQLRERWRNPEFLRLEEVVERKELRSVQPTAARRLDFCLRCHPQALYQTQSPHDQVDEKGQLREQVCLYCHKERPDMAQQGQPGWAALKAKMTDLCGNCHGNFVHPLGIPHLVEANEAMLTRMVAYELQDRYVISLEALEKYLAGLKRLPQTLPVDPKTHEATCNTCHNPHEAGVLPPTSPLASGAEGDTPSNYRLRMPREEICLCCHRI